MKLILAVILMTWCECQQIVDLSVPLLADPRRAAELRCQFYMGEQMLHSVKWYRDQHEIFRYIPSQTPQIRLYNASGVAVLGGGCERDWCEVRVLPSPAATRAAYSCEVSSEGPRFHIAAQTKHMTTAVYPSREPVISGVPLTVRPGEPLQLNCSTDYSLPPADIRWLVNGQPHQEAVTAEGGGSAGGGGLRAVWRVLPVRVPVVGALQVTCVSTVPLPTVPPVEHSVTVTVTPGPAARTHTHRYTGTGSRLSFQETTSRICFLFVFILNLFMSL